MFLHVSEILFTWGGVHVWGENMCGGEGIHGEEEGACVAKVVVSV